FDPARLHRPQRADQGQQGRLPGSGGAGHDDELTGFNLDAVVEQDLIARFAVAEEIIDVVDPYGRARLVGARIGHQKTSAGSAASTRRIAKAAANRHIPRVRANVVATTSKLMCSGNRVMSASTWARPTATTQPGRKPASA